MSLQRNSRGEWSVRWREAGRNRSKLIGSKADAKAYEAELLRARRMGTLAHLEMGTKTLSDFAPEWWHRHAKDKAKSTQQNYAWVLDGYIIPRFGDYRLRDISVAEIEDWMADLSAKGTGTEARRKALKVLKQLLTAAVKWSELATNPAALVSVPSAETALVIPPTPLEVEAMRAEFHRRDRHGEAVLVSTMAYAGLRPHECWPLTKDDITDKAIIVRTRKKTGAKGRAVPLCSPLKRDLAEWCLSTRQHLVFPNTRGNEWTASAFNNWRRRVYRGTEANPGVVPAPGPSPYALRHTFVSLLIREGLSVVEVAKRAGHSPEVCLKTYAHIFDSLPGTGSMDDAIRAARAEIARQREAS